jgi:hypothetical protein
VNELLQSLALGAVALWVSLVVALVVAWIRRTPPETLQQAVPAALVTLALQTLYFVEQFGGNYQDFLFYLVGRQGWPDKVFIAFNLCWIAVWALACAGALVRVWPFPCAALLWFLGIAALLNGVMSPALSLLTTGYFPGLVMSPFLWLAGLMLVRPSWKAARSAASTAAIEALTPSAARLVTPCALTPQGTMPP